MLYLNFDRCCAFFLFNSTSSVALRRKRSGGEEEGREVDEGGRGSVNGKGGEVEEGEGGECSSCVASQSFGSAISFQSKIKAKGRKGRRKKRGENEEGREQKGGRGGGNEERRRYKYQQASWVVENPAQALRLKTLFLFYPQNYSSYPFYPVICSLASPKSFFRFPNRTKTHPNQIISNSGFRFSGCWTR